MARMPGTSFVSPPSQQQLFSSRHYSSDFFNTSKEDFHNRCKEAKAGRRKGQNRRICISNVMSSSQGSFIFRTFLASPRRGGFSNVVRRNKSSAVTLDYLTSSEGGRVSVWGNGDLELEDLLIRNGRFNMERHTGRIAALGTKELVQPSHLLASTWNSALQVGSVALRSSPPTWGAPSRTVKVAYQAVSKTNVSQASNATPALPQYARRVGRISAPRNQPLLDLGLASSSSKGGEAWERAAQKLGWAEASLASEVKAELPFESKPLQLVAAKPVKIPEIVPKAEHVPEWGSEAPSPFEKLLEENLTVSPEGDKPKKKTPVRKTAAKKKTSSDDSAVEEDKPKRKSRAKKVQPVVQELEENDTVEEVAVPIVDDSNNEDREVYLNESVMVIDSVEKATAVVQQLMGEYKDLVHACDTEVGGMDVKKESPVGHGSITCFSIYCGPSANFGEGKNRLWVDVLDGGGEDVLKVFKPYFEAPHINKVWHNYSFDKHILSRHGIQAQGFYADTMHLARLNDSARRGAKGGYSLEVLSADEKVMDSYIRHVSEKDDIILAGKKSMKDLFGKANLKKDGTPGKIKTIPPVEELQRGEQWRAAWIHYSTFDAVCTWRLWQSLQQKLQSTPWTVADLKKKGSMYDFYEKYWRPFGEVLVKMEADGMLVDCDHLTSIEKVARQQQQISVSRFRKWAAKYCPDAALMNVGSDAQIRQFLFGGTANRKDSNQVLPMEREFNVPNNDGYIEEGKKVAKKTKPIVITGLANFGIKIPVESYTSSGWPAVGGAAIKALAGKVAIDYTALDADAEDGIMDDIEDAGGLLTSAGVESNEEEDVSVYGKAYVAFGKGQEGKEACMALAALCEVASINTLLSNFIEPLLGNDIKSVSDGRVHCSLNINTETGRLSARRPSLQNQPALEKDRYKIRQAFVAAPGKSLVVADYGQLELRLLAHLADCKSMKAAFKAGGDFHSRTAMNMYPHVREAVEKERVLLEWEGQGKPPAPLLKDMFGSERRKAKMLNFSIAYGKTAMGLAKDWKVNIDEAKATVNLWYSDRPEVLAWQKERKKEAHDTMRVHTLLGRARHLPDVNSSNSLLRSHMERAAINTPVQGSAADVAMCAMLEINRNEKLRELGWKLLLQVHDEVILEGPEESAAEAKDLVIQSMMYPFDGENFLDVELAVDGDYAQNWYAAK